MNLDDKESQPFRRRRLALNLFDGSSIFYSHPQSLQSALEAMLVVFHHEPRRKAVNDTPKMAAQI